MRADTDKTIKKLNIVRGQIDGIIRMLEDERYCIDISNQLMAATSALKGINRDVLGAHLRHCVRASVESRDEELIEEKMEEITKVIDKLSK